MSNFYRTLKDSCYEKVFVAKSQKWTSDMGNGICDLHLNSVNKLFDVGDCCHDNLANDDYCKKSNIYCHSKTMGDGKCHDNNNGPLCDYDLGDCCVRPGQMNATECCRCECHNDLSYDWWDDYKLVG